MLISFHYNFKYLPVHTVNSKWGLRFALQTARSSPAVMSKMLRIVRQFVLNERCGAFRILRWYIFNNDKSILIKFSRLYVKQLALDLLNSKRLRLSHFRRRVLPLRVEFAVKFWANLWKMTYPFTYRNQNQAKFLSHPSRHYCQWDLFH